MKTINFFSLTIAAVVLTGCTEAVETQQTIDFPIKKNLEAEWLLGEWKYEDENGTLHEDWSRKNDTVFLGESYFIEKDDTLFFEYLRLIRQGDSLFYESIGEDKINPKVKTFKGLYDSENKFEIENLQHSFPRRIRYNQLHDTLMIIEISGIIDGSEETQPYQMTRTNHAEQ